MKTPHTNAIALRIYGYAQPLGWDCTVEECAHALGLSVSKVGAVVGAWGWTTRFRASRKRRDRADRLTRCGYAEDTRDLQREIVSQFAKPTFWGDSE